MSRKKKVLIIGISGQDGSYLAEFLLEKGYEVHGMVRRTALEAPEGRLTNLNTIMDHLILHSASLDSYPSLTKIIEEVNPDECYHLAAQSFVSYSFDDELSTINTNINGTHHVLSAIKEKAPQCRLYFAASSEMFGKATEVPQTESTSFKPRSLYGISKMVGFELTRNYRELYGFFFCSGILFNHESPRRALEFVTRKITHAVVQIKLGLKKELVLGNLDARRDWGFSKDYVEAMWLMLQQGKPDDYVIATGETHSVKEFLKIAFDYVELDWANYVITDKKFYRPSEEKLLVGDSSKAKRVLGWTPRVNFKDLVEMMVEAELRAVDRSTLNPC